MQLTFRTMDDEVGEKLNAMFNKPANAFVEVNPGRVVMPRKFVDIGQQILDSSVRSTDIWMISFPRTGSTWAQEMVWLLANKLDYDGANKMQQVRAPLLELTAIMDVDHPKWLSSSSNSVEVVESLPDPRFIKTHLPWDLLPREMSQVQPKIIYVARNPKDLCVSYYHYCVLTHGLVGSFESFCELFLSESLIMGSMWSHYITFWNMRHKPNVLFIKYEDMKRDLRTTIRECAEFLDVADQFSDDQLEVLIGHLNFNKMQINPAVNLDPLFDLDDSAPSAESVSSKFIRKGEVGDWKNYMSTEMSARFDRWIEANLCGTDLTFDFE